MKSLSDSNLINKIVVITRAQDQQSEARKLFSDLGAKVLDFPSLAIGPPDDLMLLDNAIDTLDRFDWIIFSSANGVRAIEERLNLKNLQLSGFLPKLKVAVIGRKTAKVLSEIGISADYLPPDFVADSLIEDFPFFKPGLRVLIPRVQSGGRTILKEAFAKKGSNVVEIAAYESKCPSFIPKETLNAFKYKQVDLITFASSKTVSNCAKLMKDNFGLHFHNFLEKVKIISIGPQTSKSCLLHFNRVDREAKKYDLQGLIDASVEVFTS